MGDDSRDWKEGSSQGKEEEEEEESRDSIELVCQLNVIDTGAVEKSKKRGRKEGEVISCRKSSFVSALLIGLCPPFLILIYVYIPL